MMYLQLALVLGLLGLVVYLTISALTVPVDQRRPVSTVGEWRVTHRDVGGATQVLVEKVSPGGDDVLDQHVVASVRSDDPEYDEKFLTAMATARERKAMFESEDQ